MRIGDVLVLYTDGISEACNSDFDEFGQQRLEDTVRRMMLECPDAGADEIRDAIGEDVRDFAGNMVQYDDITLLIIKRVESPYEN